MTGQARSARGSEDRSGNRGEDVMLLSPRDESAALWVAAFGGQWGHKTPDRWPPELPPGSSALGLRHAGELVGVCRFEPDEGLIDAPGLLTGYRTERGYGVLLAAAMSSVRGESVTVESWGDAPDRVRICERLGLATVEYVPGWEFDLD
jgi:hypothetical protein